VKNESCTIWKRRAARLIVVFAILLVWFGFGRNTISPKLQDGYIRPGLSQGMCGVFDKYRQYFPDIMAKDKNLAYHSHWSIVMASFGQPDLVIQIITERHL